MNLMLNWSLSSTKHYVLLLFNAKIELADRSQFEHIKLPGAREEGTKVETAAAPSVAADSRKQQSKASEAADGRPDADGRTSMSERPRPRRSHRISARRD